MKKIIVFVLAVVLLGSCTKDKDCDQWYEGSNCDVEMREKFYGIYIGTIYGAGTSQAVSTSITPGSNGAQKLKIDGMADAELSSSTTFTFPYQTIIDLTNGNWVISQGSGVLDGDNLTYSMYTPDGINFSFSGSR